MLKLDEGFHDSIGSRMVHACGMSQYKSMSLPFAHVLFFAK